jgi:pyridoxamine 5'-phosphate oxidase
LKEVQNITIEKPMKILLDERTVLRNPIDQFRLWFKEAGIADSNPMTLATASNDGKPSARIVLLKNVDERGFIFYSNYDSRKGRELLSNPHAAIVFHWPGVERQVRAEGMVTRIGDVESDAYFHSRPRESQISAVISSQSEIITSREELEKKQRELTDRLSGLAVPRPVHWGGYCLKPDQVEFWQSRESRLHDRIMYQLQSDGSWTIQRLSP